MFPPVEDKDFARTSRSKIRMKGDAQASSFPAVQDPVGDVHDFAYLLAFGIRQPGLTTLSKNNQPLSRIRKRQYADRALKTYARENILDVVASDFPRGLRRKHIIKVRPHRPRGANGGNDT